MLREQCKLCKDFRKADPNSKFPQDQVDWCYNSNWKPTGYYSKNDGPAVKCISFKENPIV